MSLWWIAHNQNEQKKKKPQKVAVGKISVKRNDCSLSHIGDKIKGTVVFIRRGLLLYVIWLSFVMLHDIPV